MKLLAKHIDYILTGSLAIITLCIGSVLLSNHVDADPVSSTASANASVNVAAACSMTALNTSAHTISMVNSTTEENVGITTLTATCNDAGGLAIYAVGYSGDEYGNTNMIGTTGNIATGTNDSTSNWSMRLYTATGSITPSSITSTFTAVPSTYTKFAELSSGTTGSSALAVNATYRFHISATQPADTYTGKVKYTLVHPATDVPLQPQTTNTGKIHYWPNGSGVVGTMGEQDVASSVTLLASNYSRQGYGFAGWNTEFDYSGTFYGPNETISLNTSDYTGTNPGLSLYAVWVKSQGNLQDSTKVASVCTNLTQAPIDGTANLASVSALTDQRDNNTYAIAKLADGKCWMIENMRLDNTNSDNSTGALAQGYATNATYGNFAGLANPEDPWANNITTANSLYSTDGADNTTNIGTTNAGYRFPRYNNQNTASRASSQAADGSGNTYSYGNYYTWAAAIADLNNYTSRNASVTNTSICPTGWHLPTGGLAYASGSTSGVNVTGDTSTFREFYNLGYKTMGEVKTAYEDTPNGGYAYYSSNTTNSAGKTATAAFRSFPNNFLYSGSVFSGSVSSRGSAGSYWSSTAYSSSYAYYLSLDSSGVYPGTNSYIKYFGRPIRCLVSS